MGVLAALWEARSTGRGQVVDAAIVDGTAHMLSIVHSLLAEDRWTDRRGTNLIDGGAPFFAAFVRLLGVEAEPATQYDRTRWDELRTTIADAFATRTQQEWTEIFAGSDACVAPVLSLREAAGYAQLTDRRTLTEVDGVLQAMPAPRFSRHPVTVPAGAPKPGQHTEEVLAEIGSGAELDR
jgi:alpha-methylacyl-CoA racemase